MALPASWTQVKVFGTYLRLNGTPNTGQIWFDSSTPVSVQDETGTTVLVVPQRIVADLDTNGYFEVMLPATTDRAVDPQGWTYQVKERIADGLEYSIDVPAELVSLNLVPMRPKLPDSSLIPPTLNYLTTEDLGNTVARQGDVNTLNSFAATAAANSTAALSTANDAQTAANNAAQTATTAANTANDAKNLALTFNDTVSQASADASAALTAATQAQTDATTALNNTTQASTDASNALTAATAAQTAANNASSAASAAQTTANGLSDQITAANNTANAASTTANNASAGLAQFESDLASGAAGKGTTLVGYDAVTTLKQKLDNMDTAIASGGGGGGGGTFTPPGTGAVVRSIQNKLLDFPVSVLDYHQSTDGSNYTPAVTRALAVSKSIFFPRGTYLLNTAISMVEGMCIIGDAGSLNGGTILNCNSSFLINPDKGGGAGARKHIQISNLNIKGNNSGKVGIDGEMGGFIDQCSIAGFSDGVNNPAAFLTRYSRINFANCTGFALNLSDFNGGTVTQCQFTGSCAQSIQTALAATDGGGQGYPFVISQNLYNIGSAQANKSMNILWGTFEFKQNYCEDYSGVDQGTVFVEVRVSKYGTGPFSVKFNEVNGKGDLHYGVMVVAPDEISTVTTGGEICYNRFEGISNEVHFGDKNATTHSHIEGVKIWGNTAGDTGVMTVDGGTCYRPYARSTWTGSVAITSSTPTALAIGAAATDIVADNRGGFSGSNYYKAPKDGLYEIYAKVTATAASYIAAMMAGIYVNGTLVEDGYTAVGASGKETIPLTAKLQLASGDTITVRAGSGDTAVGASFEIVYIAPSDGWS